jgi:hypothetical protein
VSAAEDISQSALANRSTVRGLVAAFQSAESTVRASFAAIVEAEEALNAVFTMGGTVGIRVEASRHGHGTDFTDPDCTVERMARQAWGVIVERLELRRMMSIARWNELQEQLDKGKLPAITEENVNAFARGYAVALPDMIQEAVGEVFDWLRPWNTDYKTNSKLEIGPKVILAHVVELAWTGGGFRVNHYRQQNLVALENVFRALDGQGNIAKTYQSELETAIGQSGKEGRGETSLFRFKAFRNQNVHLEFKRLDLLKRFNQVAGGRRLKPAQDDQ